MIRTFFESKINISLSIELMWGKELLRDLQQLNSSSLHVISSVGVVITSPHLASDQKMATPLDRDVPPVETFLQWSRFICNEKWLCRIWCGYLSSEMLTRYKTSILDYSKQYS